LGAMLLMMMYLPMNLKIYGKLKNKMTNAKQTLSKLLELRKSRNLRAGRALTPRWKARNRDQRLTLILVAIRAKRKWGRRFQPPHVRAASSRALATINSPPVKLG
jgi:hypothetical protein